MMPGVVMMENGFRDALPTNHDRDQLHLVNGGSNYSDRHNGIGNGSLDGGNTGANTMVNGNGARDSIDPAQSQDSGPSTLRMNDLPDEIQHITQGFVPLGLLLSRLAQKSHNQLTEEIMALSKMAIPAPAVNGNSAHAGAMPDDNSPENLNKKIRLLNFARERHSEWTKALVIAQWSRKADQVSKLIDLMNHLNGQRSLYDNSLDYLINVKRDLTFARLPNPDLRTALHVLSTGSAPWMPELNYIEPPPLTPKEQQKWIDNINTLLSIRLNLEDHENIPYHFQDYNIDSGRVIFKVPGEFEVDLTIADEDFEKQFWFIDFRFDFTPAPADLTDSLRIFLEGKVNEALEKDGLHGCYKFLHEFVLTHKVTEYVRQAFQLTRGRWVDTLKVERLNRAMSIQYWVGRFAPEGPKSWVILGVHSGKKANVPAAPDSTSHLTLRWFRDNKEVKDIEIPFDDATISTEDLLKSVICRHIEYILTTIHARLQSKGRFQRREAGLALYVSKNDPIQSVLKMQLGHDRNVTLRISPTTGMFSMEPQSIMTLKGETRLNWQSKDPVQDGLACLEGVRCHYVVDEINRRGKGTGWSACKGPVKGDVVKEVLNAREMGQLIWLKRRDWAEQWYLMVNLSLSGDRWWLIEISQQPTGAGISSHTQLPLSPGAPKLEDSFFSHLTIFTASIISHITNLRTLHQQGVKYTHYELANYSLPRNMRIPVVCLRLQDILRQPQRHVSNQRVASWAYDYIEIMFKGIDKRPAMSRTSDRNVTAANSTGQRAELDEHPLDILIDARIKVIDPSRFSLVEGSIERDVAFHQGLGVFALRLRAGVGSTILDNLVHRLQAIEKLANCIDAIRQSSRDVKCEEITLNRVVISYTDQPKHQDGVSALSNSHRWKAIIVLRANDIQLTFEQGNTHLRVSDLFQRLLNSDLRFEKLPFFLSSTLSIHRALDSVKFAWKELETNGQGRFEVFPEYLDLFSIRYTLRGAIKNAHRLLTLRIRLEVRKGTPEWHIFREEPGKPKQPDDDLSQALKKVWDAEGRVWRSLVHSAVIGTDQRAGELIEAIDEAIRSLALQSLPSPTVSRQGQPRSLPAPPRNMGAAAYHTSMAQGRARPQGGAVVVLDD
ncbi:MED14-domain-containing protein [Whalleya microplaca]|nr:MED14-domain-containing protein [Whalleya microplaca]